jgi:WD40 repeat protein
MAMNKALLGILIFFVGSSLCTALPEEYPLQRGHGSQISALSWSPGNDLILTASGYENALRLWDVGTGRLLWKTDVGFLQDDLEPSSIHHAAWTSDQKLIVTGNDNGKLQLWEAASGTLIWNTKAERTIQR